MVSQPISQLFSLSGKVAVVTGGGMGIGQATALRLAEAGAALAILDIDRDASNETVAKITADNGTAVAIDADVSLPSEVKQAISRAVEYFGGLDILVNNAAIYPFAAAISLNESTWDHVLQTNLKGAFFSAQAAADQMIAAGKGGRIVNLASAGALRPTGNLAHYDASKSGIIGLTKALALEFAQYRITVNAIAPGEIQTPGTQKASTLLDQNGGVHVDNMSSPAFLARIPLGRLGEPDDIAKVVLFLASAAADYMTGSCLVVDGGFLLT